MASLLSGGARLFLGQLDVMGARRRVKIREHDDWQPVIKESKHDRLEEPRMARQVRTHCCGFDVSIQAGVLIQESPEVWRIQNNFREIGQQPSTVVGVPYIYEELEQTARLSGKALSAADSAMIGRS